MRIMLLWCYGIEIVVMATLLVWSYPGQKANVEPIGFYSNGYSMYFPAGDYTVEDVKKALEEAVYGEPIIIDDRGTKACVIHMPDGSIASAPWVCLAPTQPQSRSSW